MTLVTGIVNDAGNRPDDTEWVFWGTALRGGDGESEVITTKRRPVRPMGGRIAVDLEPGVIAVQTPNGLTLYCEVPDQEAPYSLWELIESGVPEPSDSPYEALAEAITAYLDDHPELLARDLVVGHGVNANYTRPSISGIAIWVGSVPPSNAINGDVWLDNSGSAPVVLTTTLNPMTEDVAITPQQLVASGTAPMAWSVTAGTLPTGVLLSTAGILYGTPTTAGAYSFTVTATNGFASDDQPYSGTIS